MADGEDKKRTYMFTAKQSAKEEPQNGTNQQAEMAACYSKKLQDDLKAMGLKIKQHEQNIKFLKSEKSKLDDSILDMQVILGKYHIASAPVKENDEFSNAESKEGLMVKISNLENSAAGIYCQLATHHGLAAATSPVIKDIIGIVATLGSVDNENLSGLLSEYLGMKYMLAIVCKTFEGIKAFDTGLGIHGIGASMGRQIDGSFNVICLENLIPYVGEVLRDDPQRRLDILTPRLGNLEAPSGFVGFAVNMINLENTYLTCVTSYGHGLRETLFYHLFSNLQVYKTKEDMIRAIPFINNGGAISLDGGIMKSKSEFLIGKSKNLDVKFAKGGGDKGNIPENYNVTEIQIKETEWRKERLMDDIKREQELLDRTRFNFEIKKQEFVKFLAQTSSIVTQNQMQSAQRSTTPR